MALDVTLDVTLRVALPLGISLYILQSLSYVIDVYRGHSTAMRHFGDFLCFEMMYPQVVAGPIIRYSEIEDQLHFRTSTPTKFARGVSFFALGLAKKVLIANPCGKVADLAFEAGSLRALDAWYASPRTHSRSRLLTAFFLAAIVAVPAIEIVLAGATGDGGLGVAWSRLTAMANEIRTAPAAAVTRGFWERIIAANHIALNGLSAFERALEDDSLMARALRPTAQRVMTGLLGAGNERVYPGRDRWLFYRPDVDYLTGRGFLDPVVLERRISDTPEWDSLPQPDPLQAIVRFHDDLAARGIALIVMPTPPKPAVHPEKLAGEFDGGDLPANPSLGPLLAQLQARGVLVFNPRDVLTPSGGSPQYLATDTHWRPEAMEAVAEGLTRFMAARVRLEPADDPGYRIERSEVMNVGDTARMLDLPAGADLFPAQSVWLRRPVGRIVQNDDGAFATRAMLQQNPQRLDGKKVVVYQFAERELAFGDWKKLDLRERALSSTTP